MLLTLHRRAVDLAGMLVALIAVVPGAGFLAGCSLGRSDALVVYCAHDSVYSEQILRRFERETGIPVAIKFDTEATKSLGLVQQLIAEKDNPRCDVFWNNEVLGTMDLFEQGLLLPYRGTGHQRIPDAFKDPEGHWTGFGARLRVYIVNTENMEATPEAIAARLESDDLSRFVMARPLYGTTLTHYSLLWHIWGGDELQRWHTDARRRGLIEAGGNAQVKDLVAGGVCDFGWTDTDDFFAARDAGQPVAMLPIRVDGATVSIPNSVAIIRGTSRPEQARQLVDFLLSEEIELALSQSDSRQIPLGPVDEARLSAEVRQLKTWAAEGYDLNVLIEARTACLNWLKSEYLP